jgi:iron complex transport system substrate-binding protein
VVSLAPSTTEAIAALGGLPLLVGRSAHCDFPVEVTRLPSVGGYADPDVERILGLLPSLVVGERGPAGPALEERLRARGIATFFPPTASVAEIEAMLVELGERLGRVEAGRRARATLERRLARISEWGHARRPVRAVLVFDARPLYVAGPGGFPDELLRLAGGTNAVTTGGAYPTLDLERMLALDPDVIVDASAMDTGASTLGSLEGWSSLRAVREGRVRRLEGSSALRPGPRLADGARALAKALHGEAPPADSEEP